MRWTSAVVVGILAAAWIALGEPDQSDARFAEAAPPPAGAGKPARIDPKLLKEPHAFPSLAERPGPEDRIVTVARGDTLIGILTDNGVDRGSAHEVVRSLGTVFDVRRLQIGQDITLTFLPGSEGDQFLGMALRPTPERDVLVKLDEAGGFVAEEAERALDQHDAYAAATIESSLYEAALAANMPIDVLMDLVRVFSFDVDFQRDVQAGDRFEVLYDGYDDEFGERVRNGEIRYAAMTLSGKTLSFYKFTPSSGVTDYFGPDGRSVRKTLMRTPVDGARLSSGFGARRHPILGYTKMHKGADFAASNGTPIMAAGDGVVEMAGWNGGYGNYVRIRHNSEIKTAYAHTSRFAKGIRVGSRVKQGQIVAYVGSTGRSTGPHLHYEVLLNGRQVNPMSVKLPAGEQLLGKDLRTLQALIPSVDSRVAAGRTDARVVASNNAGR
ncbi:MAG: M23 family metallopeptidase [Thalassobaculum sp.]|uniref:M23 family metallopeptidase n=1 Tax=Thalassobaculum sp. TaxID=2022740 RepID=UPI0032EE270F